MHIDGADIEALLGELRRRGFDARPIKKFSMTELNNEITRRRMEAERTEVQMAEIYAERK
jgi:hypothetical protein